MLGRRSNGVENLDNRLIMRVHAVLYDSLDDTASTVSPEVLKNKVGFPGSDGVCICSARKFIVLMNAEDTQVIVGPIFSDTGFYFHRAIFKKAQEQFSNYEIAGGGYVEVRCTCHDECEDWHLLFGAKSTEYGKFDASIETRDAQEAISHDLGMPVQFM